MKSPKQLLKELRLLKEKLTPALQQKVGNLFLGANDKIVRAQGAKVPRDGSDAEPDTEWEEDLNDRISTWLNSSEEEEAEYFRKNKKLLDQLAVEFPTLLQPPVGKPAYRGTSILKSSLEKAFRTKQFDVKRIGGREVFHFKNLKYSPNRQAQSWTIDPKKAFGFKGKSNTSNDSIPVVYVTTVDKNFIFNPLLLRLLWGVDEKETIRVAGKGTFEAFVDSRIVMDPWELEPSEKFVHKLPSAKPYFDVMVAKYNKVVDAKNKAMGEELLPKANSIQDILYYYETDQFPFADISINREYTKYAKKYINSLK